MGIGMDFLLPDSVDDFNSSSEKDESDSEVCIGCSSLDFCFNIWIWGEFQQFIDDCDKCCDRKRGKYDRNGGVEEKFSVCFLTSAGGDGSRGACIGLRDSGR